MGYTIIIGRFGLALGRPKDVANAPWIVTMTPYVTLLNFYFVREGLRRHPDQVGWEGRGLAGWRCRA